MRSLLLATFLIMAAWAHAQMLLVAPGDGDPAVLRFNPQFIARNGVSSVSGRAWVKRDGQPMRALDRFYLYRFGSNGRLDYSNNSFGNPGSGLDTASVMYTYDADGRLGQELHNDLNGFFALRTTYNAQGLPEQVAHVRLENRGPDRYHFEEGASTVVSEERFEYAEPSDTVRTKTWLNDQGRPYMKETFIRDRNGYLQRIEQVNLITQRRGLIRFRYDEKGHVAERRDQPDLGKGHWTTWQWTYDAAGNPLTCDLARDGSPSRHGEFLYAEGSMFLKATVTKDHETGLIEIVRYETSR
jgi:hypothetical protein